MQFRSAFLAALLAPLALAVPPIVKLSHVTYNGTALTNGITEWLGMRYAAPPVGNLRFKPPKNPRPEEEVQDAKSFGDLCLVTGSPAGAPGHSEDCLFINVQAPSDATTDSRLPVLVWLRGDGYNNTQTDTNINAVGLLERNDKNFIVVTLNHRLGPYGFLGDGDGLTTNNGIRDQVEALKWVKENIHNFGGNSDHVVLGGSGIGAQNVMIHLTSIKKRNPYFKAIIAESPSFATMRSLEEARDQYLGFSELVGCEKENCKNWDFELCRINCLRSLTADAIQEASRKVVLSTFQAPPWDPWLPVIDRSVIVNSTSANFRNRHIAREPFLMGTMTNPGTAFLYRNSSSTDNLEAYMHDLYPYLLPKDLDEIVGMYPNGNDTCGKAACAQSNIEAVHMDAHYTCPTLFAMDGLKRVRIESSYLYHWEVDEPTDNYDEIGVRQNIEAATLFGPEYATLPASYQPGGANENVPALKQRYWCNFIRSLDPNRYTASRKHDNRLKSTDGKVIHLRVWNNWWDGGRRRFVFGNGGQLKEKDTMFMKWPCTFWNRMMDHMRI